MKSRSVTVINPLGIHARPSAMIVRKAASFQSQFWIEKNGNKVNARNILNIMTLAASKGTVLTLITEGPDEEQSLAALAELFDTGFGEI
ncbi:MAG: hypothetical protein RL095_404 [Verrucomicrobiota bacterium]|jgi:phosphocarrier protein